MTLLSAFVSQATAQVRRFGSFGNNGISLQPVPVENSPTAVVALEGGNASSYELTSAGEVFSWGLNNHGQLGIGTIDEGLHTAATKVQFPPGVKIAAIGEAQAEGMAIDTSGQGWGWGFGLLGSLCLGHSPGPTPMQTAVTNAKAVQGGEAHTLWLLNNGTVVTCGVGSRGQLGNGSLIGGSRPVAVLGLTHVVEISAGQFQSCARTESGEVWTWGGNEHGQLGNGSTENSAVPVHVPLPGPASNISCGGSQPLNGHSLAVVEGEVWGWGSDHWGQVGDAGTVDKLEPVATGIECSTVVASGYSSICLNRGNVYTWGAGIYGALGSGSGRTAMTPLLIDTGMSLISATSTNAVESP